MNSTGKMMVASNAQAIALLQHGKPLAALAHMRVALNLATTELGTNPLAQQRHQAVPSSASCSTTMASIALNVREHELDEAVVSPANLFTLYNRAFFFDDVSDNNAVQISLCILFNLALACHKCALSVGARLGRPWFDRAHKLYEMILSQVNQRQCDTLAALTMGALANVGHLHSHLGNTVAALACRDRINAHFAQTMDCLEPEDYTFFYFTVLHTEPNKVFAAAA